MAKIAFLGLGAMGSRMARSLIAAGHEMTVWNRSAALARALADHGAMIASSPRAAATGADIVIAMLRDDQASRSVWLDDDNGALAGMSAGALAIECSTLTVAWARELAGAVHTSGHSFLDAPVVGSRPQADGRQLIFLAGGAASDVERATPFFSAMGQATHHVGGNGCGSAVKLAVNALFAIQVAGMAELITMLKADGVDITARSRSSARHRSPAWPPRVPQPPCLPAISPRCFRSNWWQKTLTMSPAPLLLDETARRSRLQPALPWERPSPRDLAMTT